MSKQSDTKKNQNYQPKGPTCATCNNLQSEMVLPTWMQEENDKPTRGNCGAIWFVEKHGVEKNMRCSIGGFAVKKQGCCDLWVTA
ncbi:MAG: hypothetical protein WC829_15295 [Hyphomicrobium sp.]|jgi:hypothetical protein